MAGEELKRLVDAIREDNAASHEATRRHFDVVIEATRNDIRLVADSVALVHDELKRTRGELDVEIRRSAGETQAMIKFSHAELDRRVSALEVSHRALEESVSDLKMRLERLESSTQ